MELESFTADDEDMLVFRSERDGEGMDDSAAEAQAEAEEMAIESFAADAPFEGETVEANKGESAVQAYQRLDDLERESVMQAYPAEDEDEELDPDLRREFELDMADGK